MPPGLKLAPEDVWTAAGFVLSVRMQNPQFAGQTKEKLSSRESAASVSGVVKDAFALWLNQHPEAGERIAQFAIGNAQERTRMAARVTRKRIVSGPALPGKLADCTLQEPERCELFLVEGDSAGGSAKQARDRSFQAVMPLRGKILNTWEVEAAGILASQDVHDIGTALGVDAASSHLSGLRYHKICIQADGLDPATFDVAALVGAVRAAGSGEPETVKKAVELLSRACVTHARALQRDPKVGVIYVDADLKPAPKPPAMLLAEAARASSLATYIRDLGWMNPIYGQLREALVKLGAEDARARHQLALNLERARALPPASVRYVLINSADQRLTMYEKGRPVGQMKIVAGRANAQTPLMNAYIRFAVMNPYWNVPADLSAKLAPKVLQRGKAYLNEQGYQVVSGFDEGARVLDPLTIDWKAVAAGELCRADAPKAGTC